MNDTASTRPNSAPVRTVFIQSLDKKGKGAGVTDTKGQMTVPYTLPGEEVRAQKARHQEGRLVEVLTPSPHRTAPVCGHFGTCGGCAWQHIDYAHQLELKQGRIAAIFGKHNVSLPGDSLPITPSSPYGYRNRMDFVWWYDGRFGLRQAGRWYTVEDLRECHLIPPHVFAVVLELKRRALGLGLPFHDQKKQVRGLRYFVVRLGIFTSDIQLNIVSDTMEIPPALWADLPITSVYQLRNDNLESQVSDGEAVLLAGNPQYEEEILGRRFRIGPRSFFQPNPAVAEEMVRHVRDLFDGSWCRNLLDLYCGVGLFTALLAERFVRTLGVEISAEAVALARENAKGTAAEFECSAAEESDFVRWRDSDALLVDPPRTGLHVDVLKRLPGLSFEEIVYVSCNPEYGVRDLAALSEKYALQSVRLFDQFPQTPHVEMIAHLRRK